ncbi:hypothetical protein BT69DRAFT_1311366 [Atractiella rhizophila]|nr:hypothetical protein BT69DRAFT_1311366 [Atractiella rhizophila]
MRAYYFEQSDADQRDPHDSGIPCPSSKLDELGVLHFPAIGRQKLDEVAVQRSYKNRDIMELSKDTLKDEYEKKLQMFYAEHLHEDEEIRYILEGSGYFDVRDKGDSTWIRIHCELDDLIILPAGIYHRFTLDHGNFVKVMRLFKEAPIWVALNRGDQADAVPCRKEYLHSLVPSAA